MAKKDQDAEKEAELGRLGMFLGFRLRRLQNQLSRDFSEKTKSWEIRQGMFSSLEIISANPGVSQAALSTEVGLDKSAIVPLIDDMESRGWVVRTRSTSDRRRNHLTITDSGRKTLNDLIEQMTHTEARALATLTAEERAVVSAALDKVYHAYVKARDK